MPEESKIALRAIAAVFFAAIAGFSFGALFNLGYPNNQLGPEFAGAIGCGALMAAYLFARRPALKQFDRGKDQAPDKT